MKSTALRLLFMYSLPFEFSVCERARVLHDGYPKTHPIDLLIEQICNSLISLKDDCLLSNLVKLGFRIVGTPQQSHSFQI